MPLIVSRCDEVPRGGLEGRTHRLSLAAGRRLPGDHPCARRTCELTGSVGRAVVHDDHFVDQWDATSLGGQLAHDRVHDGPDRRGLRPEPGCTPRCGGHAGATTTRPGRPRQARGSRTRGSVGVLVGRHRHIIAHPDGCGRSDASDWLFHSGGLGRLVHQPCEAIGLARRRAQAVLPGSDEVGVARPFAATTVGPGRCVDGASRTGDLQWWTSSRAAAARRFSRSG